MIARSSFLVRNVFSDGLSQSSNHILIKNYQSDGEVSKMLYKFMQQQGTPGVDIDTFFRSIFHGGV